MRNLSKDIRNYAFDCVEAAVALISLKSWHSGALSMLPAGIYLRLLGNFSLN
jgi:hypothetical protein